MFRTITNQLWLNKTTSLAAAGADQAGATELTGSHCSVSGANGSVGVRLPVPGSGRVVIVYNEHATNGLKIYPHSGGDINDGTPDAAITIEGKTMAIFRAADATTWWAQYTTNT